MRSLREFTMARVGLARAGQALATAEVLRFQLAHAAARDAVHEELDVRAVEVECAARGWASMTLRSAAMDRISYLRRPDLGRRLAVPIAEAPQASDIAIVIVDGLSALAVHRHALPMLDRLIPLLDGAAWLRAPVCIVTQGRVAIGDEIGLAMRARLVLTLIGERPGLSSPDSLGAYLTWHPRPGRTDAERNCISNIRPEGLGYEEAAARIFALAAAAREGRLTGVALKEDSGLLDA